jgi:hypothetical protein
MSLTSLFYAVRNRRLDLPPEGGDDNDGRNLDDGQNLKITDLNQR